MSWGVFYERRLRQWGLVGGAGDVKHFRLITAEISFTDGDGLCIAVVGGVLEGEGVGVLLFFIIHAKESKRGRAVRTIADGGHCGREWNLVILGVTDSVGDVVRGARRQATDSAVEDG